MGFCFYSSMTLLLNFHKFNVSYNLRGSMWMGRKHKQISLFFYFLYSKILNAWVTLEGLQKRKRKRKWSRKIMGSNNTSSSNNLGEIQVREREMCESWSNEDLHPTGWHHIWEVEGFQRRSSSVEKTWHGMTSLSS